MKIYPNTDFYLINYWPGSSGTFLQSLMALIYHDAHFQSFTGTGNAYKSIDYRFFNERLDYFPIDDEPIFKNVLNVAPMIQSLPIFSRSHNLPDLNLLYKKFPKTKHFIIQLDETGQMISCLQDFQKNFKDQYRYGSFSDTYHKWKNYSELYFNGATHPNDVTVELLQKYAKHNAITKAAFPYDINDKVEFEFCSIKLTDLYFKSKEVLNIICDVLDKPLTIRAIDYYNQYLNKQKDVLKILDLGYSYI